MALYTFAASLTAQQNSLNDLSVNLSSSAEPSRNECSAVGVEGGARVASH